MKDASMSTRKKLIEKIRNNPADVSYDDLRNLVENFGYELRKGGGGSHRWFRQAGFPPIHFPEHKPIKKHYVEEVIAIIEKYFDVDEK
jgi:hypothetical protein